MACDPNVAATKSKMQSVAMEDAQSYVSASPFANGERRHCRVQTRAQVTNTSSLSRTLPGFLSCIAAETNETQGHILSRHAKFAQNTHATFVYVHKAVLLQSHNVDGFSVRPPFRRRLRS